MNIYISATLANIVSVGISFFGNILVARLFDIESRGSLAEILFLPSTISSCIFSILPVQIFIKLFVKYGPQNFASSIPFYTLIVFVFGAPFLSIFYGLQFEKFDILLFFSIVLIYLGQVSYTINCAFLRASLQLIDVNYLIVVLPLVNLTFLFALWGTDNIHYVQYALCLGIGIVTIGIFTNLLMIRKYGACESNPVDLRTIALFFRDKYSFSFFTILATVNDLLDRFLLIVFSNVFLLGVYVSYISFIAPLFIILDVVTQIVFANAVNINEKNGMEYVLGKFRAAQISIFFISCCMVVFGPWAITFLLGERYATSIDILYWMICFFFFKAQNKILDGTVLAIKGAKIPLVSNLFYGIIFISLSIPLINKYGLYGLMCALITSSIISLAFSIVTLIRTCDVSFHDFNGFTISNILLFGETFSRAIKGRISV